MMYEIPVPNSSRAITTELSKAEKAYISGAFCITGSAFPNTQIGDYICSHEDFAKIEAKHKDERIMNIRKNEDTYYMQNELVKGPEGFIICQNCGIRPANKGYGATPWFPMRKTYQCHRCWADEK